jgi:hypothetical protein
MPVATETAAAPAAVKKHPCLRQPHRAVGRKNASRGGQAAVPPAAAPPSRPCPAHLADPLAAESKHHGHTVKLGITQDALQAASGGAAGRRWDAAAGGGEAARRGGTRRRQAAAALRQGIRGQGVCGRGGVGHKTSMARATLLPPPAASGGAAQPVEGRCRGEQPDAAGRHHADWGPEGSHLQRPDGVDVCGGGDAHVWGHHQAAGRGHNLGHLWGAGGVCGCVGWWWGREAGGAPLATAMFAPWRLCLWDKAGPRGGQGPEQGPPLTRPALTTHRLTHTPQPKKQGKTSCCTAIHIVHKAQLTKQKGCSTTVPAHLLEGAEVAAAKDAGGGGRVAALLWGRWGCVGGVCEVGEVPQLVWQAEWPERTRRNGQSRQLAAAASEPLRADVRQAGCFACG